MKEGLDEQSALERTAERLAPSVVKVEVYREVTGALDPKNLDRAQGAHWANESQGSGFFVSKDGIVATNRHVVSGGGGAENAFVVQLDSKKNLEAEVLYVDPVRDFALLKVPGKNHPPMTIGDSDTVRRGMTVTVAGNPLGVAGSFSQGTVTSVPERRGGYITTDGDIRSGSSGGVMLNAKDEVIGINTAANLDQTGSVGCAIPINEVKTVIQYPGVFQGVQVLFKEIQERREGEEPITLESAFNAALEGFEIIFRRELSQKASPESVRAIMSDAAVQYYFSVLLRSARSLKYKETLEKKFGVSFGTQPRLKVEEGE